MISTERAQAAIERVGAEDLDDLVGSFGEMTQAEIEVALREMYPQDQEGIEQLASDIYETCQAAEWLKEMRPKYF